MKTAVKQPGMSNAEYLRALRQKALTEGKCYTCRCRPARIGARYCDDCIQRSAETTKAAVARRICINCFCNLPRNRTAQVCLSCANAEQERRSAQKESWASAGLCSQCGKQPCMSGHRRCLACNEDGRLRMLAFYRAQGTEPIVRCSICKRLGLSGINHTKKTHARYMAMSAQWSAP
jgi:hypothetical protein